MKDIFKWLIVIVIATGYSCLPINNGPKNGESDNDPLDIDDGSYQLSKEEMIELAVDMLNQYSEEQNQLFENEIIPMMMIPIADKFAEDFEKILEEYNGTGGFKLYDNYNDFQTAWSKIFNFYDYKSLIDNQLKAYNEINVNFYNNFCRQFGLKGATLIDCPLCFKNISIPKDDIENYVSGEQDAMIISLSNMAVDGLLVGAEIISSGAATPLVVSVWCAEMAKAGYDISSTVDELFFDDSIGNNEKLMITITDGLCLQISSYLAEQYAHYFDIQKQYIIQQLKEQL